ncbi:lysophospholipid acyltransferase family protein [Fictibacillus iocasae]|uniref:Lysophospholipid acyltransferase family protein n=1 Tax=Fictibacillus iocasae TaxID=2715437 RepID=A0ABW2NM11_9BACL
MNLYGFGKTLCRTLLNGLYHVEIIHAEKMPADGGVLLCANHIHNFDPPLVGVASNREVHFMAKAEIFHVPVLKSLLPKLNAFPVKRGMSDKSALKTGLQILRSGKVLGLFPEGTRSKSGETGEGLAGAGFFALKSDAAVVPCAIIGEYKFRRKVKIVFGDPVPFEALREKKASAQEATSLIMEHIKRLKSEHA